MPKRTAVDRRARAPRCKIKSAASTPEVAHPPTWIKPQLTRLVDEAPTGNHWMHEIKYDGYRMHARIDGDKIRLLTRTGLDWSHRYKRTIEALHSLKVKSAYLDGELCALNAEGVPVSSRLPDHRPPKRAECDNCGKLPGTISTSIEKSLPHS
jgi:ATP-dependent DNA ligase